MASELEEQLREIAGGGWDSLDQAEGTIAKAAKARMAAEIERQQQDARVVRDALTTPAGQKFFEWLKANTVLLPPMADELNATTAEFYAIAKARREGQNAMVFKLMAMMTDPDNEGDGA